MFTFPLESAHAQYWVPGLCLEAPLRHHPSVEADGGLLGGLRLAGLGWRSEMCNVVTVRLCRYGNMIFFFEDAVMPTRYHIPLRYQRIVFTTIDENAFDGRRSFSVCCGHYFGLEAGHFGSIYAKAF